MTRRMFDAMAVNASSLVPLKPPMVAGYDTGSGPIQWGTAEWDLFPGIPHVHIDQAGSGAPVHSANVMDVEPLAYRPGDIPGWMSQATAPRPTVYCDRNDLPAVKTVWHGDIWLADPTGSPPASTPDPQVVSVQFLFASTYDESVVFDPYWPEKPPTEVEMLHGMLNPSAQEFVPFPAGTFKGVYLYHDFGGSGVVVRVAVHSATHGYQVTEHAITGSVPEVVVFAEHDVDGVSLVNESGVSVGWSLA